jgi:hypothetical protein
MKKRTLVKLIGEGVDKTYLTNMNEDSYYDGHKFVEYGKNIDNVSLIMPSTDQADYSINKEKLSISWGAKFEFRNSGIEGVQITILSMEANLITSGEIENEETPINFAEYKFNVIKEKNPESKDLQIFINSIEVDVEQRIVNVTVSL